MAAFETPVTPCRVILVHGTGAADEADRGSKWWQVDSPTARKLAQRLPPGTRLNEQGEVFHWSGENDERERIRAGRELLEYLSELETRGEDYHLVGHSHGGSVIWHALRIAKKSGQSLERLRSWTTVGTPFLHYRSRSAWSAANLANAMLAVLLLRPAVVTLKQLARLILSSWYGIEFYQKTTPNVDGLTALLQAPFTYLLHALGVAVVETENGLQIGQFNPETDGSLARYLLTTREGLLLVAVSVLSIFVFLNLSRLVLTPLMESLYHWSDRRLEKRLMREFGDRWLAIWSPEDEALNGLRATLRLSFSIMPRLSAREPVLFSDHLSILARPYLWLIYPLYNRIARPLFDDWICASIARAALGDNRPAAEVVAVLPSPVAKHNRTAFLPIPEPWNTELTQRADEHARHLAPAMRKLLASNVLVTGLDTVAGLLTGKELVHTSYFDHDVILDLVAFNIAWGSSRRRFDELARTRDPRLKQWFLRCKRATVPFDSDTTVAERHAGWESTSRRIERPRRRAA